MFSLDNFRNKIKDIARPYHWKVIFSGGGAFPGIKAGTDINIYMRTAALPGLTINEVAVSYFGMTYKLAGTPTYEPLTAQFIIDAEYEILEKMRLVLNTVYEYKEKGPAWGAPTEYMGSMKIEQLNTKRETVSSYDLKLAYLSAISAIQYGHETKDAPLTFDATITYSYYTKSK